MGNTEFTQSEQYLRAIDRLAEVDFRALPPDASFAMKKTWEVISATREWSDVDLSRATMEAACWREFDSLMPVAENLTALRSIAEFAQLRRQLLHFIWAYNPDLNPSKPVRPETELAEWLLLLLPELRVLPKDILCRMVYDGHHEHPLSILKDFSDANVLPEDKLERKVVTLDEAEEIAKAWARQEWQLGYCAGKWRANLHDEHLALLLNSRLLLGKYGKLIVGVESKRSIEERRGEDHRALDDDRRLRAVERLPHVDMVVYLNPTEEELRNLDSYYWSVWQRLNPDFYFVGTRDYHWLEEFQRRARELGTIILWDRETAEISTSSILQQLGLP